MSAIRLQFVLGTSLSSRLISWWGQGYDGFSHVDAVLANGELVGARSDVVGGKPAGVQVRPANYEKWKRRCLMALSCTQDEAARWEAFIRSQVDLPYDKSDILGLIIGRPLASAGHWICSALQTDALEVVGRLPKSFCLKPQQIAPNALRAMFSALGAQVII